MEGREKMKLSTSQRQAISNLIEKKERDKQVIKNRRPITLLIVEYKIISKALATRPTLPKLISFQQTVYVKKISDIIENSESFELRDSIRTIDIEKVFDSLNHLFLLVCHKKYGYGNDFIKWLEMSL